MVKCRCRRQIRTLRCFVQWVVIHNLLYIFYQRFYLTTLNIQVQSIEQNQTMKNLQSKDLPFRKNQHYYQSSTKHRATSSIKVYPTSQRSTNQVFSHSQFPYQNYLAYVGQLYRTRTIQRRPLHKEQYYSNYKKKHNKKLSNGSLLPSERSLFPKINDDQIKQKIHFQTITKREKSMSFYNDVSKTNYIIEKFHDYNNLEERGSPKYQNSMNRTIAIMNVMQLLKQRSQKIRRGDNPIK